MVDENPYEPPPDLGEVRKRRWTVRKVVIGSVEVALLVGSVFFGRWVAPDNFLIRASITGVLVLAIIVGVLYFFGDDRE